MVETLLLQEIKKVLSHFPRYWNNETLLKNRVVEDLRNYKPDLISSLLNNKKIKGQYEFSVNNTSIFKIEEFIQLLMYKNFWKDSYTKYSNKIGLTSDGKYLDYSSDMILSFPFKDCVLKGGMTKEYVGTKEIYYNKIIARDELDTLLASKVFTNIIRYTPEGTKSVSKIRDTDNLIIKGNNLLALHSLKEKYADKVKLIYIDPPYNTGGDSFKYNDNFNHSTWLTFMKNRLDVAYQLLSDEGSIFVHIDDNEVKYMGVLLDEIFGSNNFVELITIVNNPRGRDYGGIANMHEFIYVYKKTSSTKFNSIVNKDKEFPYEDSVSPFEIRELRNRNTKFNSQNRPNLFYPIYINPNSKDKDGFYSVSEEKNEQFSVEVFPKKSQEIQTVWRWGKNKLQANKSQNVVAKAMLDGGWSVQEKYRKSTVMARSVWWDKDVNSEKGTLHLKELMGDKVFDFPKPEGTLKRIIEIATNPGDLVLDFFMGSATTQSVAMKMNRQFIGIEQMDYINMVSVPRLQKVIKGEQGGISKDVDWQGGGSFIYAELMDLNSTYAKSIQKASTSEKLLDILEEIKMYADLNYLVEIEKLTVDPIIVDEDTKETLSFEELPLDKQKKLLIDIMDINQLYVNYSEIDDKEVSISEEDKAFNRSFYEARDN